MSRASRRHAFARIGAAFPTLLWLQLVGLIFTAGPSLSLAEAAGQAGVFDATGRLLRADNGGLLAWLEVARRGAAILGGNKLVLWAASTLALRAIAAPYLDLAWMYALAKRRGFRSVTLRAWRSYWKAVGLTLLATALFGAGVASLTLTGWLAHKALGSLTLVPLHDGTMLILVGAAFIAMAAAASWLDLSRAALCRGAGGMREALRWGSATWSFALLGDYLFWLLLRFGTGMGALAVAIGHGWLDQKSGWPMLALTQALAFLALLVRSMWLSDCLDATARANEMPGAPSGELLLPVALTPDALPQEGELPSNDNKGSPKDEKSESESESESESASR